MNLPSKQSPIWSIAIIGSMISMLCLMLIFNYHSVDARDPVTVLAVAITGICVWTVKLLMANKDKDGDSKDSDSKDTDGN